MQTDLGGTEMPPVPLSLFTPQSLSGGAGRGERGAGRAQWSGPGTCWRAGGRGGLYAQALVPSRSPSEGNLEQLNSNQQTPRARPASPLHGPERPRTSATRPGPCSLPIHPGAGSSLELDRG